MKPFLYIIVIPILAFVSCSTDDNSHDSVVDSRICNPYINESFTSSDISDFATDENTQIVGHRQDGNCLILNTQFPGGCEDHILRLLIDESNDASLNLSNIFLARLSHNNSDQCEALVSFDVYVDISTLKEQNFSTVQLSIENYDPIVELVF